MAYLSYQNQTKVIYGNGSLDRLKELDFKRCFIVTDKFIAESDILNKVTSRLDEANIKYFIFKDALPNAPISTITIGINKFIEYKPDFMLALGGGSSIDTAKAIREFGKKINDDFLVYFITVPTTSGTGSEVTLYSVIFDEEANVKYELASKDLLANEAILDFELVKSLPASVTADTGMDVFTHAMETIVCKQHNYYSDAFAKQALELVGRYLVRSYHNSNDSEAREAMHIASNLAGFALNNSLVGLNHSIAHALGATFGISHGKANAMVLPYVIEFNTEINLFSKVNVKINDTIENYVKVAKVLGIQRDNDINTVKALILWVKLIDKELNIPNKISELNICTKEQYMAKIDELANKALVDLCTQANPREASYEDIKAILIGMW